MTRLVIELREDIQFEDGAWRPSDDRARALVAAVEGCCSRPERLFSRPAPLLDRDRVAVAHDDGLPDLNLFYVVDGEPGALRDVELIAEVAPYAACPAAAAEGDLPGDVALAAADAERSLADVIDLAAAAVGAGHPLLVPMPLAGRAAWAAAEVAARRGVRLIAIAAEEAPPWAKTVVVAPPGELAAVARGVARVSAVERAGHARLTLRSVLLAEGGDLGTSEIYVEGWVEEDGERSAFRVPQTGAVRGVRRGDTIDLDAVIYVGKRPAAGALAVHIEVWEEDLGRDSLLNPDDLLGIHEARYLEAQRWGEGVHEDVQTEDGEGKCLLTYSIELVAGTAGT